FFIVAFFFFFFFSSRRRHTRSYGDWSSDVCSSDLGGGCPGRGLADGHLDQIGQRGQLPGAGAEAAGGQAHRGEGAVAGAQAGQRSEERRVGKECRSRGAADHEKRKKEERRVAKGRR